MNREQTRRHVMRFACTRNVVLWIGHHQRRFVALTPSRQDKSRLAKRSALCLFRSLGPSSANPPPQRHRAEALDVTVIGERRSGFGFALPNPSLFDLFLRDDPPSRRPCLERPRASSS